MSTPDESPDQTPPHVTLSAGQESRQPKPRIIATFGINFAQGENMNDSNSVASAPLGSSSPPSAPELAKDAVSYWEWHRVGYNVILILVTLAWLVFTWRHFRPAISWGSALLLLVLAAVANACCCAAYPVDIFFQRSSHRSAWLRRRWILWSAGVILAVFLACYWIVDEIYPFVN